MADELKFKVGDKVFVTDKAQTHYLVGATGTIVGITSKWSGRSHAIMVECESCPRMPDRAGKMLNMEPEKIEWVPENNRLAACRILFQDELAC